MSNYIKREDAKKYLYNFANKEFHKRDMVFAGRLTAIQIMDVPSADVAPVRHGCLVDAGVSASGHRLTMCTICKRKMREGVEIGIVSRYCPNCGVRLDEEAEK